jgi:hypothetical protein
MVQTTFDAGNYGHIKHQFNYSWHIKEQSECFIL